MLGRKEDWIGDGAARVLCAGQRGDPPGGESQTGGVRDGLTGGFASVIHPIIPNRRFRDSQSSVWPSRRGCRVEPPLHECRAGGRLYRYARG